MADFTIIASFASYNVVVYRDFLELFHGLFVSFPRTVARVQFTFIFDSVDYCLASLIHLISQLSTLLPHELFHHFDLVPSL